MQFIERQQGIELHDEEQRRKEFIENYCKKNEQQEQGKKIK